MDYFFLSIEIVQKNKVCTYLFSKKSYCVLNILFIFADSCNDSPKILYRGQNSQGKVLRLLLSVGDIHKRSKEGYNKFSVKLDPFPTSVVALIKSLL